MKISNPPFIPQFGSGAPGATVPTNQLYYDTATTPYTPYVYVSGAWHKCDGPEGSGTVTSVGLTLDSGLYTVSGSPVNGAGTLAGTLNTQTANTVFAGATSGGAATPAFRALVNADLPAASRVTSGSWTPSDTSGAGLVLTGVAGKYINFGDFIAAWAVFTYPVTADATAAQIGGWPFTFPTNVSRQGTINLKATAGITYAAPNNGTTDCQFVNTTTIANLTNANLSTANIYMQCIYPKT